jgi:hypothetical protein
MVLSDDEIRHQSKEIMVALTISSKYFTINNFFHDFKKNLYVTERDILNIYIALVGLDAFAKQLAGLMLKSGKFKINAKTKKLEPNWPTESTNAQIDNALDTF